MLHFSGSFLEVSRVPGDPQYDTDTGHKKTLGSGVRDTDLKYSNMRTSAPRFKDETEGREAYFDAVYQTDTGHKKTLTTAVEDTPYQYSNVRTKTKRFPHAVARNSVDETQYNTDCGDKTTLWRNVNEKTENRLSIIRSKAPR